MTDTVTSGKVMFEDEEALYNELKNLPDFDRLPLPDNWYKKFNIPRPEPVSLQDFALSRAWLKHKYDPNITYEIRQEPAPGGVRPIIETEPIPVEIITKDLTNGTSPDTFSQPQTEWVPPTATSEIKPQES
jgi:hypothetical protein